MKQIVIRGFSVYFCIFMSVAAHRRTKRIIGGRDLPDHTFYSTQFAVSLHKTHNCITAEFDHKFEDCEKDSHHCGGSLITADFVLTACHCLTYTKWFADPPPIRLNITLGDFPPYIDDRIHNRPLKHGDPLVHRKEVRVEHPLLTHMTVVAGHTYHQYMKQKRHGAKFFVHHLCADNEIKKQKKLWKDQYDEIDIGLVKTCYPFHPNKDVQLAPLKSRNKMDEHLHRMVDISATCLFIGWGFVGVNRRKIVEPGDYLTLPEILQHMFEYIQCNSDCSIERHNCVICARYHGARIAAPRKGDSGSPLICDGFVTGVHSRSKMTPERNLSTANHIAVACVKDFISEGHLSYLRSLTHEKFHYANGMPIDGTFP